MFFNQNIPKMKLFLQKNAKFSCLRRLGALPPTPIGLRRLGAPPPYPQTAPHCEFLAKRPEHVGVGYPLELSV